jgi:Luciferase-like monooxygenase
VNHGVYTPTFGEFDERALVDLAARAEATGWDGFFVWDHVLWDPFESGVADSTVVLTGIALATSRIRFLGEAAREPALRAVVEPERDEVVVRPVAREQDRRRPLHRPPRPRRRPRRAMRRSPRADGSADL